MNSKKRAAAFFAAMSLFFLASNFAHPVTPALIVERNLDSSMFGVSLAAMYMMNFLFSPFWGKLCEKVSVKKVLLICCIGYAIGQGIFAASYTEITVMAGRMFAGIFVGGIFTAASIYVVNTSSSPEERGKNLTVTATLRNVFNAVGYFVGGMLGVISVNTAFICQVIALAGAGIMFFFVCVDDTADLPENKKKLTLKDADPFAAFASAKNFITPMTLILFIIVALCSIGQNSFEQCFNYSIKDRFGLSSAYNGIFKAVIALVSLVANTTLGIYLQKKTDINKSFLPITIGCTVPLCAILFFDTVTPFFIADVIFYAFNAVRLPLMQNMAASRATPENSNAVMGVYNSVNSLGAIFGALFAGLIYDADPSYPFVLAACVFCAVIIFSFIYVVKYKKGQR